MKKNFGIFLSTVIYFSFPSSLSAQNIDINLLRDINPHDTTWAIKPARDISNFTLPISVAIPVSIFVIGEINNNQTLRTEAFTTAGSLILSEGITFGLKALIRRPRPFTAYSDIKKHGNEDGYSFPSGHTTAAFALATSISLIDPKWYVITPAFAYAGAVGFSRMYLGMHFPLDVLCGMVIGSGTAILCHQIK